MVDKSRWLHLQVGHLPLLLPHGHTQKTTAHQIWEEKLKKSFSIVCVQKKPTGRLEWYSWYYKYSRYLCWSSLIERNWCFLWYSLVRISLLSHWIDKLLQPLKVIKKEIVIWLFTRCLKGFIMATWYCTTQTWPLICIQ